MRSLALLVALSAILGCVIATSCSADGGSGTCINTESQKCTNGILVPGYCAGPSNIVCCVTDWGSCSVNGASGKCEVTSACSSGHYYAGHCPGPSNVDPAPPPPPPPPHNVQAVINFANAQWSCVTPACTQHVARGQFQSAYECAEFVARSLAAGGFIPISSMAPQSAYGNFDGYNLLLVTGLYSYLTSKGWRGVGTAEAGYPVMGNAGDGSMSHTCIGIASDTVDCHNAAFQGVSVQGIMYLGVDHILAPPSVWNATKIDKPSK